ncbi:MAG: TetR family transcriptional regulator C-terminal domain-containing protein [Planctomycetes bacterium]|nr:TetR family transcriptional regulator C-terminal domain-containing protein [Planctomycetota bacterium]
MAGYRSMLEMTEFRHGCPIGNLVLEVGETHPQARALLAQNFDGWLEAIEECFGASRTGCLRTPTRGAWPCSC